MESRKYKRISIAARAIVKIGNQHFEALTKNLCLDGLLISTDHHMPVGQTASIDVKMPSISRSSDISLDGVVVRSNASGVAFRFKTVGHDTFVYLKTVLNRKPLLCH